MQLLLSIWLPYVKVTMARFNFNLKAHDQVAKAESTWLALRGVRGLTGYSTVYGSPGVTLYRTSSKVI